jgi:hypothetical protein
MACDFSFNVFNVSIKESKGRRWHWEEEEEEEEKKLLLWCKVVVAFKQNNFVYLNFLFCFLEFKEKKLFKWHVKKILCGHATWLLRLN